MRRLVRAWAYGQSKGFIRWTSYGFSLGVDVQRVGAQSVAWYNLMGTPRGEVMKARIFWSGFLVGLFALGPTTGLAREESASASLRPQRARPLKPQGMTLESLIPQDVVAAVFLRDLSTFREGVRQSALARAVIGTSLPLAHYLRELADQPDLSSAAALGAGVRYALVIPEATDPLRAVVLAEAASNERAARAVERLRAALGRLGPVRQRKGPSVPILQASQLLHGEPLGFARFGRVLLFGPTMSIERLTEDQATRPKLAESSSFRLLRERCAGGTAFAFLNLERITPYLISRLTARPASGSISLVVPILQFIGLSAFKAAGFSLAFERSVVREEQCVLIERGHNAMIAALTELPAIEFVTAHAIPEDTALVIFAGLDLIRLYEATVATLGPLLTAQLGGQSPEAAIALLETQLGFRIKGELLAALGTELAIAWSSSVEPTERALIFSVRNPDLLRTILEKVAARQGQRPITDKSYTIYPLTDDASIAVTTAEAIVARPERVQQLLEERERGRVLGRTPEFAQWMRERPSPVALGIYATRAAFRLPWLRPLVADARAVENLPPQLLAGFGVSDPSGLKGTLTSALGSLILLDALLTIRSGTPESSLFGVLTRFTRILAEGSQ